jgi:hypothetical protein
MFKTVTRPERRPFMEAPPELICMPGLVEDDMPISSSPRRRSWITHAWTGVLDRRGTGARACTEITIIRVKHPTSDHELLPPLTAPLQQGPQRDMEPRPTTAPTCEAV